MLNWIKFISIFLFSLTIIILITIYYNANAPISSANEVAIEKALESGQVNSVESAQPYNGNVPSVTVFGENSNGEEIAVFIDNNTEEPYKEVKLLDGISAETAIENVKKEHNVKKLLHVSLGMEEAGPVWEVAFKSENGKLNYVYVFFENGQWWKRILNL